jgi:acyl-CoA thioesterase
MIPILYHVEHVRSGRSFATRTVQARQRGAAIFTTTMSFVRENSGGARTVRHAVPMPAGIEPPGDEGDELAELERIASDSPFESRRLQILDDESAELHLKKARQWVRARGRISPDGGHQAHLSALAYISDSYFIGTVSRIHNLWRFSEAKSALQATANASDTSPRADLLGSSSPSVPEARRVYLRRLAALEGFADDLDNRAGRPEVGMVVSLDHSIYFHEPRKVRADEWVFTEMESPWAGDGRGVVTQKMWARDGTLIATCFQEGVVRLKRVESPAVAVAKL